MKFDFVTSFPGMIDSYMGQSLMKKAIDGRVISYEVLNPRQWSTDRHQSIDDKVFGGGEGMVGKVEPYVRGLREYRQKHAQAKLRIIHLSPQGKVLTADKVRELGQWDRLCFICSRYSGLDQRVLNEAVDEEISLGDYVVAGGELPALILTEAICRFLPGFLGDPESAKWDSFSVQGLEGPLYTQPRTFDGADVPEVYLQGNHKKIDHFRKLTGLINTLMKRPDLQYKWEKRDLQDSLKLLDDSKDSELEVLGFLEHKSLLQSKISQLLSADKEK